MSFKAQTNNVFCLKKLCACLLLCSASAFAAESELTELSLDQLLQIEVQTVSKYAQTLEKVPAIVTVVSGEDFKRYGWRNVADMLRTVPGFYLNTRDRTSAAAGVTGISSPTIFNQDILVLLDGHRLNENNFDQGLIGDDSIFDVDLIEHVEIIRGPASSVYGGNALLGVVNVITKKGKDFKWGESSLAYSSGNDRTGRITYGTVLENGADLLISGNRRTSDGFSSPLDNTTTLAQGVDGLSRNSFLAKLSYQDFSIEAASYDSKVNRSVGYLFSTISDPGNFTEQNGTTLDIKTHQVLNSSTELSARLFYDHDSILTHQNAIKTPTGSLAFLYGVPTGIPGVSVANVLNQFTFSSISDSRSIGLDTQIIDSSFSAQRIIYGAELTDRYVSTYSSLGGAHQDPLKKLGVYVQDEIEVQPRWFMTLGLRYDNDGIVSGVVSPRLSLVNNSEKDGTFKFLYGSAFRSPNLIERTTISNSNPFNTERIKSYALTWDSPAHNYLYVHTDIYRYNLDQLIGSPLNGSNSAFANLGNVIVTGASLSVEKKWSQDAGVKVSYTYNNATISGAQILDNSPKKLLQANTYFPIASHWSAAYELQYIDSVVAKGLAGGDLSNYGIPFGSSASQQTLPSQFVNNISLRYQKSKSSFDWSVSVFNVFNRKLLEPADDPITANRFSIVESGRVYRAAVRIPF